MNEARIRSVGPETDILTGQNIRRLREALGWSLSDLYFAIRKQTGQEISVEVLRAIEKPTHERRVTMGEGKVLAQTLGVSLDALIKEPE